MRFICDKCKAKYSIADEKIKKKVLKIRCKKCSHVIIVRDTSRADGPAPSAVSSTKAPQARNATPQARNTAPQQQRSAHGHHQAQAQSNPFVQQNPAPHAAQPSHSSPIQHMGPAHEEPENDVGERTVVARISSDWFNQIREEKKEEPIWFVAAHGQPVGPIVLSDVKARIQNQELTRDELVWCAGWPDWLPAGTVTELQSAFNSQPGAMPPPPPPVRAPQPQAPQQAQTQPAPQQAQAHPFGQPQQAHPFGQPQQSAQANPFGQPQQVRPAPQPTKADPFGPSSSSDPFGQQKPAAKPQNGAADPFQSARRNDPFAPQQSNGSHAPQPAASDPFAQKGSLFGNKSQAKDKAGVDIGAPKPAASHPFGAPSSGTSTPSEPAKDSPLSMLAEPAPAAKPTPQSKPTPWEAKGAGQALQTKQTPQRNTPAEVLTAAPAPQPPLSELTPQPGPTPADKPKAPADDIAHVKQARPAVELVELEAGAEADFFKNAEARKTQDDDLFEVALPPLPNWEKDAEEIDADDIIEIQDAIKPRWGMRLLIGGGVVAAIVAFVVTISWLMGGFNDPLPTRTATGDDGDKSSNGPSIAAPRKVTKAGSALLDGPSSPTKIAKAARKKRRRRSRRKRSRRIRVASARKVKLVKPSGGTDANIYKSIYQAYKNKMKGSSGVQAPSKRSKPAARTASGDSLSYSLKKRLYNEVKRNQGQVKYCYEQYLKKVHITGRLSIQIRIEQSGQVSRVRVLTQRFRRLKISQCIARKMKRWRFSSFSGTPYIETTVPYLLRAQ